MSENRNPAGIRRGLRVAAVSAAGAGCLFTTLPSVALAAPGNARTPGPAACNDTRINADLGATTWHMRIVIGGHGAPAPGCEDNYALVDSCQPAEMDECGDSLGLVRFLNGRWIRYTSFPTDKCMSQVIADRVPRRWSNPGWGWLNC